MSAMLQCNIIDMYLKLHVLYGTKSSLGAPRYIRNVNLYRDIRTPMLPDYLNDLILKFFLINIRKMIIANTFKYLPKREERVIRLLS